MGKERFQEILKEMAELHDRKNKDYAGSCYLSNFQMSESIGIPAWKGVIVRMTDKMSRLMNLAKSGNPVVASEGLNDTLTDLAIYSVLARILIEEGEGSRGVQADPGKPKGPRTQRKRRKSVAQVAEPLVEGASVETA